ncbi:MAG: hypothetical protein ABEI31_03410 [Halodesulfurarchaeum sp.]
MSHWGCAIEGCRATFEDLESLIVHQVESHPYHECRICDAVVPSGFFAIQHVFDEHTRAEYVRFYDSDSDAIRWRESIKDKVEANVDLDSLRKRLVDEQDVRAVEAVE